jgi:hypothetical protein
MVKMLFVTNVGIKLCPCCAAWPQLTLAGQWHLALPVIGEAGQARVVAVLTATLVVVVVVVVSVVIMEVGFSWSC